MRRLMFGMFVLAQAIATQAAASESYPTREIRLIVSGTPGQGTDVVSRLVAQELSERLNQHIVVENRPGAGGSIAANFVAKAEPDGYTLLMATNATHAANPAMYDSLPYDHLNDFTPIALVGMLPMMVSVASSSNISSIQELLRAAKENPGKINIATPSSSARVTLQLINQLGGVELFPVVYKGSGPAFVDLFGGRIDVTIDTVSASMPQIAGKKLRPLAVTTSERFPALPNVPTLAESGLDGFDLAPWNALMAPKGAPAESVSVLNSQVVKLLNDPKVSNRLVELGILPRTGTPDDLKNFVHDESKKWGELISSAGLKAN